MRLYLSSFRVGDDPSWLRELAASGRCRAAHVPNALDVVTDRDARAFYEQNDRADLEALGFSVSRLDLIAWFGREKALDECLYAYDLIWASGGNVFALRQAMRRSGLDAALRRRWANETDLAYGGFSAGICVLGPTLEGLHLVDDPEPSPYGGSVSTCWEGLDLIPWIPVPHYRSGHAESDRIDAVVRYLEEKRLPHVTMRDGESRVLEG